MWLGLRFNLVLKMRSGKVIHHGLLILTAAQQGIFLALAILQLILLAGTQTAAKLYCFELSLCAFTLLLLLLGVKLESSAPATNQEQ
jgi:hypothetical protein